MKNIILALFLLFSFINCGGNKEDLKALLGTDANHDGVRDDVKEKIDQKYKTKLLRAYMMDAAKVYQKILREPTSKAVETQKEISRIISCKLYLKRQDNYVREHSLEFLDNIKNYTLNTKKRMKKYLDYNQALSGGAYGGGWDDQTNEACSEGVKKILKAMKASKK